MMKYTYNIIIKAAALVASVFALDSCLEKYPQDAIVDSEAMTSLS